MVGQCVRDLSKGEMMLLTQYLPLDGNGRDE
jgi:hypothetical protein